MPENGIPTVGHGIAHRVKHTICIKDSKRYTYELGQPKNGQGFLKLQRHRFCELGLDNKIGCTDPDTTLHMQKKKVYEKFQGYRR